MSEEIVERPATYRNYWDGREFPCTVLRIMSTQYFVRLPPEVAHELGLADELWLPKFWVQLADEMPGR
jgi:hypothetical protein